MATPEKDLPGTVELLVDAVTNLVLDAVTGSLTSVKQHCQELAQYTSDVVMVVQDVALATRDTEFQIEITNCINDIASSIETLITAFEKIVKDLNNPAVKKEFALASKEVGEAINRLVAATDTSFSNKIFAAVDAAEKATNELVQAASVNTNALMSSAKESADKNIHLARVCTSCINATSDNNKAKMLTKGVADVKSLSPEVIMAAKSAANSPGTKPALVEKHNSIQSTYNLLREAAKIVPSFGKRFSDAFDYVRRFLELAQDMEDAARRLVDAVKRGCSNEEFMEAARRAAQIAKDMIRQAEIALQKETDPVRRAQIEACIQELRDGSTGLLAAAKTAQSNPTPENIAAMEKADEHLRGVVKKMAALINPDDLEGKLFHTAQYLEDLANKMMANAPTSSSTDLIGQAKGIGAATVRLAEDGRLYAESLDDPRRKQAIQHACDEVKKASAQELAGIKALAGKPGDQALLDDLRGKNNNFIDKIHDVRVAAGLAAPRERGEQAFINAANLLENLVDELARRAPTATKDELLAFAKRIAEITQQVIKHAEEVAAVSNPAKKRKIYEAIDGLKAASSDLINIATALAEKPGDAALVQELQQKHKVFKKKLQELRVATGTAQPLTLLSSEDNELLRAALEQVQHALALADEADQVAASTKDAAKKKKIEDAIATLRSDAQAVQDAVQKVRDNPDEKAFKALDEAQRNLGHSIEAVIELTVGKNGFSEAMRLLHGDEEDWNIFQEIQDLVDAVDDFMASQDKLSPEDFIKRAKELAVQCNALSAKLRKLAEHVDDKVQKEQLLTAAKVIRDKGIQLKMLTAVRVATGNYDDKTTQSGEMDQVKNSSRGLKSFLKDTDSILHVIALKRRVKSANRRAKALKNILDIYRKVKSN